MTGEFPWMGRSQKLLPRLPCPSSGQVRGAARVPWSVVPAVPCDNSDALAEARCHHRQGTRHRPVAGRIAAAATLTHLEGYEYS